MRLSKLQRMDLTPSIAKPIWLDRFATHLGTLDKSLSPQDAYAFAEETFPDAADLTPEEAAEIFALEKPPNEEGAPDE